MNNKVIIPLILSFSLIMPNNQSNIEVNATSSIYDDVGKYFEVEDTDEEIVVCFTNNAHSNYSSVVNYVIESGREVWSQPSLYGVDEIVYLTSIFIPPIHFGPLDGDQIEVVPTSYYCYIADSDNPVITEVITLQNNIESVIEVLSFMEDQAIKCGITSQSDRNNAIAGAIRAINKKYVDGINDPYTIVCGSLNESFINYINSDYSRHIRSIDYFSYFIHSSNFNHKTSDNIGYTINTLYCTESYHSLVDPLSSGTIDLVHLFAVIDGNMNNTGRDWYYSAYFHTFDYVVSFMGDIQTGLVDIEKAKRNQSSLNIPTNSPNYIDYYNIDSFESFTALSGSCPLSNINTDMDGFSIAKSYIGSFNLYTAFDNYYYLTFNRLITFRTVVITDDKGANAEITVDNFKDAITYHFGLTYHTHNSTYTYLFNYEHALLLDTLVFKYLFVNEVNSFWGPNPDTDLVELTILVEVLQLFVDYVFSYEGI